MTAHITTTMESYSNEDAEMNIPEICSTRFAVLVGMLARNCPPVRPIPCLALGKASNLTCPFSVFILRQFETFCRDNIACSFIKSSKVCPV